MEQKRLFLLDGMALIYRAFFAFSQNPRISSTGINTSATFGFVNTLLEVIQKEKPSHLAVIFDTEAPTDRHIEFEAYKANREAMPEDLAKSIPYIFRLIEGFNIPLITLDGYEADDLIGTLAKQAEKAGFITYMMTPDKDFGQLVSENIKIYKPAHLGNGASVLGVDEILNRWQIKRVDQVIDILGLMGDAVDNIPGIPGVGEKTAIKLIAEFDTIENLLNNTDKLKGKLKEKVEENKDKAILSKRLATIIIDAPVQLNEKELLLEAPNEEVLRELFAELEFRTLAKRIFSDSGEPRRAPVVTAQGDLFSQPAANSPAPVQEEEENEEDPQTEQIDLKTIHDVAHEYVLVEDEAGIHQLLSALKIADQYCFDTETTSLNAMDAELVGLSFATKAHQAWYVPVPEDQSEARKLVERFRPVLEDKTKVIIAQNIKYDLMVMQNYGIELGGKLFDTMLAHYLLEADSRHNMDAMSEHYLQYKPVSITELIGKKGIAQLNMRDVPLEKIKEYAAEDSDITLQLHDIFVPKLKEQEAVSVLEEIEMPLVPVLAGMEREGVMIDKNFLHLYSAELDLEAKKSEERIHTLAGVKFNIASPKQMGEVLFEKLKLDPKAKKTKTGQYQTGEDILSKLAPEHEIIKEILRYRQISKLKSTYVDALPTLIHPVSGRVHTSFNQAVAATGRLSSQNPNLQNIPIRTEMGREVRKAFIPRNSEFEILAADYSQIELRIIAALSGDEGMIRDFKDGHDIHTATASKVFNVSLDAVDKEMRRKAKMVNFGIIYGISAFGLAQRLEIPRKEAAEIIEAYFTQYPNIKKYMNDTIEGARTHGFVQTVKGRRRYIRDINSRNQTVRGFAERNAINAPIQGSAADMIKIAMIAVHEAMQKASLKSKMILQVHDELLFEVHHSEKELLKKLVIDKMKNAIQLAVPIEVEVGIGANWLEAH